MKGFILGLKSNQSQQFDEKGVRVSTTLVETSSCHLIDVKTPQKNGYLSVLLGFGVTKNIKKSQLGLTKKAGIKAPLRFFKEFRLDENFSLIEDGNKKGVILGDKKLLIGEEVKPSLFFQKGDLVNVAGISKGKGFQGVVKRHGFAGGPRTHGQSDRERAPGSIGQTTTPGRVYKGKRMAGRMGGERKTIKNLKVVALTDTGLIIGGLVPGAKSGLLEIRKV